jgi:hypothetical protein
MENQNGGRARKNLFSWFGDMRQPDVSTCFERVTTRDESNKKNDTPEGDEM